MLALNITYGYMCQGLLSGIVLCFCIAKIRGCIDKPRITIILTKFFINIKRQLIEYYTSEINLGTKRY